MTPEDKQLLLVDLCGRLPFSPLVNYAENLVSGIKWYQEKLSVQLLLSIQEEDAWDYIKPYLRPMSSMTEEEKREYVSFIGGQKPFDSDFSAYPKEYKFVYEWDVVNYINWLNSHYFDYRGLIEKGLAIEAPEGMYK